MDEYGEHEVRRQMLLAFHETSNVWVWPQNKTTSDVELDGQVAALFLPLYRWLAIYCAHAQKYLAVRFETNHFSVPARSRSNLLRSQAREQHLRRYTVAHRGTTLTPISLQDMCNSNIKMLHLSIQRAFQTAVCSLINNLPGNIEFFNWMSCYNGTPPQPKTDVITNCLLLHFGDSDVIRQSETEQRRNIEEWQDTIFKSVCSAWSDVYSLFCVRYNFYVSLMFNNNRGVFSLERDEEMSRGILCLECTLSIFIQTLGLMFLQSHAPLLASPSLSYFLLTLESLVVT